MVRFPHFKKSWGRSGALLALTFLLSAARLEGLYAPWAWAAVSLAGPGMRGFCALLGAAAGGFVWFDFQSGLRHMACAVLLFALHTALYDLPLYRRPWFIPAASALAITAVQTVYLLGRQGAVAMGFLLALCAFLLCYHALSPLFQNRREGRELSAAALLTAAGVALLGVASYQFAPGRAVLSLVALLFLPATLSGAVAWGFLVGLCADVAAGGGGYGAAMAVGAAVASLTERRPLRAALFALAATAMSLYADSATPLTLLRETALGGCVYCLLPPSLLPRRAAAENTVSLPPSPLQSQLQQSAAAFRELYDSFFRSAPTAPPENPAVLFDGAAEEVCRRCVLRENCWHKEYNATYNAFNDACGALLRRGEAQAQDFPTYFTARCIHLKEFLSALNHRLGPFLLRRQYHQRLLEARAQAKEQYAQLGELLGSTAAVEAMAAPSLGYRIGTAVEPRAGCNICGDEVTAFEVGGTLYLLLCDGMGSGEEAHREAAMVSRLLQQFLSAGIDAVPALKTLNGALRLRGEEGGGFTTIDLLALQRRNGTAVLYKYGAAPSYLKRSGTVSRLTAAALPAGLQEAQAEPQRSTFSLAAGNYFVMVSDGIAGETEDEWLQNLLAGWNGRGAQELCRAIMAESRVRRAMEDDCAVMALYLGGESGAV